MHIRREIVSTDDILANPLISVDEQDDEMGQYVIRIGELRTQIRIDLRRARSLDRTRCIVSHKIRTPLQEIVDPDPPLVSASWPGVLSLAISRLTADYQQAVTAGYKPNEWWLVNW